MFGLLRPRYRSMATLGVWALVLALCTAAYGGLAGPALRAIFGGDGLTWPLWLAPHLPSPPSIETLRGGLPLIIVAVAVAKGVAFHRHTVGMVALAEDVNRALRERLHQHLLAAGPDAVGLVGGGEVISRVVDDVEAIGRWASEGVCGALRDGVQVVALLGLCLVLDWRLAGLSFLVYPVAFWPIVRLGRRLRRAAGDSQRERGHLVTTLHDQVGRLPAIQLSAAEVDARDRFAEIARGFAASRIKTAAIRAFASPFTEVMGAVGLALMLVYTGHRIDEGTLAAEHALSFFAALLIMYQPAKGLARLQGVIEPGRAAVARVEGLLSALPPVACSAGTAVPPDGPPAIQFERVAVERGGRRVLDRVTLEIGSGEWLAIQGPNGVGKSTLAWLLGRLIVPCEGEVRIDGRPLEDFALAPWRSRIGWVTQRPWLSRQTVRENVANGRDLTAARLEEIAALTGLETVVARLPARWETVLGDDGAGLSMGEQQRVALARALVTDPTVLILDEPTAHLDVEGRQRLVEAIAAARAGRTVVLITHYDEIAVLADRVVRLGHRDSGAGGEPSV